MLLELGRAEIQIKLPGRRASPLFLSFLIFTLCLIPSPQAATWTADPGVRVDPKVAGPESWASGSTYHGCLGTTSQFPPLLSGPQQRRYKVLFLISVQHWQGWKRKCTKSSEGCWEGVIRNHFHFWCTDHKTNTILDLVSIKILMEINIPK